MTHPKKKETFKIQKCSLVKNNYEGQRVYKHSECLISKLHTWNGNWPVSLWSTIQAHGNGFWTKRYGEKEKKN